MTFFLKNAIFLLQNEDPVMQTKADDDAENQIALQLNLPTLAVEKNSSKYY